MKKQCSKCKIKKDISAFYADKRCRDGLYSNCKECHQKSIDKYAKENKDKVSEYKKEWQSKNYEKIRQHKQKWRDNNKEKIKEWKLTNCDYLKEWNRGYQYERLRNPKNRLNNNIRCLIWLALKGKKAERKWQELVGYTTKDLMEYIEKKFDDKMTWDNYGEYWHLDHIKPQSLFNYKTAEDEEFKKCWALENLQPLEAKENIRKNNKYEN